MDTNQVECQSIGILISIPIIGSKMVLLVWILCYSDNILKKEIQTDLLSIKK